MVPRSRGRCRRRASRARSAAMGQNVETKIVVIEVMARDGDAAAGAAGTDELREEGVMFDDERRDGDDRMAAFDERSRSRRRRTEPARMAHVGRGIDGAGGVAHVGRGIDGAGGVAQVGRETEGRMA